MTTLNAVTAFLILFTCAMGVWLWQSSNWMLLAIFMAVMLRILYELTFIRGKMPTIRTGYFERQRFIAALKADMAGKTHYRIIDPGSGDGTLTRSLARALPGADILGIEREWGPYVWSRFMQRVCGLKNIEYVRTDFMEANYRDADAVVIFLDVVMTKIIGVKLRAELKPNALVITNEFELGMPWIPTEKLVFNTPLLAHVFMYRQNAEK